MSRLRTAYKFARTLIKEMGDDHLQGYAKQVAYQTLFALVPLLIFVTALSAFVSHSIGISDTINNLQNWIGQHLPSSTQNAVINEVTGVVKNQSGSLLSFGAVLALWGAKGVTNTLMQALNAAFDVKESRSWPERTAISIGLVIALGLAVVLASIFLVVGGTIGGHIANALNIGHGWATTWSIVRWPIILALLIEGLAFLYWAGPNTDTSFHWLTAGTIFTVVGWGIVTYGLQFYFAHFGSYASTYGALGGVLAFLFWLYVMSLILLLGGEINAVIRQSAYKTFGTSDDTAHEKTEDSTTKTSTAAAASQHSQQTESDRAPSHRAA